MKSFFFLLAAVSSASTCVDEALGEALDDLVTEFPRRVRQLWEQTSVIEPRDALWRFTFDSRRIVETTGDVNEAKRHGAIVNWFLLVSGMAQESLLLSEVTETVDSSLDRVERFDALVAERKSRAAEFVAEGGHTVEELLIESEQLMPDDVENIAYPPYTDSGLPEYYEMLQRRRVELGFVKI